MTGSVYVTTSIPYVNARPHIGFALELVQADVIARYHRLLNITTRFQTGTDENAFKNVLSARDLGITVQELVDRNSILFRQLAEVLNISYDTFVRTTSIEHQQAVHKFWRQLKKDDLYIKRYRGLYCTGCEDFYLPRELINGLCPDHTTRPAEVEEENLFFRLSDYQVQIYNLLYSGQIKVIPESAKKEVLSFVSGGLQDISISRPQERSKGWGIQVPDDPSQVVYVWIDALINYISGLGYGTNSDWNTFWKSETLKIHVIGKNVWKFHAVYWSALLLSAGLPLPNEIVVHGFLTENGQKISKSRGSTYDPFDVTKDYGVDAVRYYLLRGVSSFGDSDFSTQRLVALYNADLANGLGNLVNRLTTLAHKVGYGRYNYSFIPDAPEGYHESSRDYEFDNSLKSLWVIVTRLNQDIDKKRPWETLRKGDAALLKSQLTEWFSELWRVGYWLAPFLPSTGEKVLDIISSGPITTHLPMFPKINSPPCVSS